MCLGFVLGKYKAHRAQSIALVELLGFLEFIGLLGSLGFIGLLRSLEFIELLGSLEFIELLGLLKERTHQFFS